MVRARVGFIATLILLATGSAFSKKAPKISSEELRQITDRGRALYAYDQAAWYATDAVLATNPKQGEDGRYIVQKTDAGFTVAFGHLNEGRDAFLIAHIATQGKTPQVFSVERFETARKDTGFYFAAAKAIDLALKDFQPEKATYNIAVLPAPENNLYVYLYPTATEDGVYLVGGDERYTVSSDGNTLIEKHRMHHSIVPFDTHSAPQGTTLSAGVHGHVLSEVPEDTDVFYVLTRKPSLPEFIGVDGKILYQIQTDGTIQPSK